MVPAIGVVVGCDPGPCICGPLWGQRTVRRGPLHHHVNLPGSGVGVDGGLEAVGPWDRVLAAAADAGRGAARYVGGVDEVGRLAVRGEVEVRLGPGTLEGLAGRPGGMARPRWTAAAIRVESGGRVGRFGAAVVVNVEPTGRFDGRRHAVVHLVHGGQEHRCAAVVLSILGKSVDAVTVLENS